MRRLSIMIILLCNVAFSRAPYFVITNHVDPVTKDEFARMKAAYFNVRGGHLEGHTPAINKPSLLLSKGIIEAFIDDDRLKHDDPEVPCIGISQEQAVAVINDYKEFAPLGYRFQDEPKPGTQECVASIINAVETVNPSIYSYINLHPIGNFWGSYFSGSCHDDQNLCISNYGEYINPFFDSKVDAISFDYYILYDNNPTFGLPYSDSRYPLRYDNRSSKYPPFYFNNNLFKQKAQEKGKDYWVFGASSDHTIQKDRCYSTDENSCLMEWLHNPSPSLYSARFYVSTGATYGAKGISWYTYYTPDGYNYITPSSSTSIYNTIKFVNRELTNSGSLLMGLDHWVGTFHGTSTDPFSKEEGLPTFSNITSSVGSITSNNIGALSIGVFNSWMGERVLVIANKNLSAPVTARGSLNKTTFSSQRNIQKFQKFNKRWEDVSLNGFDFEVTIAAGDYEILVVNPASVKMIGDTRGDGSQTQAQFLQGSIVFKRGKPDGTFVNTTSNPFSGYNVGSAAQNFIPGDFNGDGRTDLVHIVTSDNIARVWYSDLNGIPRHSVNKSFTPWAGYGITDSKQYLVGDFNGDKKDDLLHLLNSGVRIWSGDINAGFVVSSMWIPSGGAVGIDKNKYKVADFSGDGKDDVVQLKSLSYYCIWKGTSTKGVLSASGDLSPWAGYVMPSDSRKISAITLNQDQLIDLGWWPSGQQNSHAWQSQGSSFNVLTSTRILNKRVDSNDSFGNSDLSSASMNAKIQVAGSMITVTDNSMRSVISVFAIDGRIVKSILPSTTTITFELQPGVYVVKVGMLRKMVYVNQK